MFRRPVILIMALLFGAGVCAQAPAAATDTSLAVLQKQAASGDPAAQVVLGKRLSARDDPADNVAAVRWFRAAAMQGNSEGEWLLGSAYVAGAGVTRDLSAGLEWMRKSLSDESMDHMVTYGLTLDTIGLQSGDQQQIQEGVNWIRRAAQAGSTNGMVTTAMMLVAGNMGMAKDNKVAQGWLLKAARLGDVKAQSILGRFDTFGEFGQPEVKQGVYWMRKAARRGDVKAEGALGYFLITGDRHVPKNPAEGMRWATKAIAAESAVGYYDMGLTYQLGSGEPVNPAKAWYNLAVAQHLDTGHQLEHVSEHMSQVATKLTPAQLSQLQAKVAKIPVPTKQHSKQQD